MNLVDGATTFPVPVRNDTSLARSEDAACCMEAVSRGDLAVVLVRNLVITRGLHVVDALLLMLHFWEVWNFEWWECLVAAEEVPAQDQVMEEPQQDYFGMSVAQWMSCSVTGSSNQMHSYHLFVSVKKHKRKMSIREEGGCKECEVS